MVTLRRKLFSTALSTLIDLLLGFFLGLVIVGLSTISAAIIRPLIGIYSAMSGNIPNELLIFPSICIFLCLFIYHISQKIVITDEYICFIDIFHQDKILWKHIVDFSKNNYSSFQAGYGAWVFAYNSALKRGWIPYTVELWFSQQNGKIGYLKKKVSDFDKNSLIFDALAKNVHRPDSIEKTTRSKGFYLKHNITFVIFITMALLIILGGSIWIYLSYSTQNPRLYSEELVTVGALFIFGVLYFGLGIWRSNRQK